MPDPSCTIVYSTQTGRAKACARRTARILTENATLKLQGGKTFDEIDFVNLASTSSGRNGDTNHFFLFFVSTTGDGVHCDSIQRTWKSLLKKSLASTLFQGVSFALFCLGDRAYGPQFCAAGRKLAVRLMQLGMKTKCEVGYGDDNTPNGGVFADLDSWIQQQLLVSLQVLQPQNEQQSIGTRQIAASTGAASDYVVTITEDSASSDQLQNEWCRDAYHAFFAHQSPITAYSYRGVERIEQQDQTSTQNNPLVAIVESNMRLTDPAWDQNTRHIRLQVGNATGVSTSIEDDDDDNNNNNNNNKLSSLPYQAGDIATILPSNPPEEVDRFIQTLPSALQGLVDKQLVLNYQGMGQDEEDESGEAAALGAAFSHWPRHCTLRGWLTYCADIHAPPEREELRVLSQFCSPTHPMYEAQRDKLFSLSETSASALYVDYILREKRCWTDVLYDFDSVQDQGSKLTIEVLLMLLPPIRPRDFSIASSPSHEILRRQQQSQQPSSYDDAARSTACFYVELCVAVVQKTTPLGRSFRGLCSHYLSELIANQSHVRLWIRPGSFVGLPLTRSTTANATRKQQWFESPLLCIGAGTGVAPLRGLILEREAIKQLSAAGTTTPVVDGNESDGIALDLYDNILVFGCRKRDMDYYYREEWNELHQSGRLFSLPAFSREQARKVYVQQLIKANGETIMKHILENDGAIYIAGNPSMARYSKEELVETTARLLGDDDDKKANLLFKKLQARGRFSVEAWS